LKVEDKERKVKSEERKVKSEERRVKRVAADKLLYTQKKHKQIN
jgi:hypothetical protein